MKGGPHRWTRQPVNILLPITHRAAKYCFELGLHFLALGHEHSSWLL
jgi:hypothetical protein